MNTARRPFRELAWNIFGTYGGAWLWVTLFSAMLQVLLQARISGVPPLSVTLSWLARFPEVHAFLQASPGIALFMTLVFAPFVEEALFRMLPLTFVLGHSRDRIRAVQIGICGIIFGLAHGSPINVFIQGFVGYMLGRLYVKNAESQLHSYVSCVFVHMAYNFTVLAAVALR